MRRGGTPHRWHKSTRVHEPAWRLGGVAAHRARAAAREGAPHRRADHPYGERFRSSGLGISAQRGLQKLGWEQDRNMRIDYRWSAGDPDRIWAFAAELVELAPDVILCSGAQTTTVLQRVTHTVPVVFVQVADPVGSDLGPTLARRAGNITGFTHFEYSMIEKWLEVLKETAPDISRI